MANNINYAAIFNQILDEKFYIMPRTLYLENTMPGLVWNNGKEIKVPKLGVAGLGNMLGNKAGYKGYYFENPMVANFFAGRNDYYGITKQMVLDKASKKTAKENSGYVYSNFGYAVLGLVLEAVYGEDYATLANDFAQNALSLSNTKICDKSGDLGNYWDWNLDDTYLAAGALTSNIEDMLAYAQLQLESPDFANCHTSIKAINASSRQNAIMDINMDEIGMAWIIDSKNGFIWHNGGTDDYNCYLGFDKQSDTAVVVLSNLAPSYKIPATVLGIKLLSELTND